MRQVRLDFTDEQAKAKDLLWPKATWKQLCLLGLNHRIKKMKREKAKQQSQVA